mmetsp:Transcript_43067/g.113135  ORF Transcript_43067/g.113135 Transcript_43067/m.113135 type:complete len:273 (-) Transcript_43067:74-892(-)
MSLTSSCRSCTGARPCHVASDQRSLAPSQDSLLDACKMCTFSARRHPHEAAWGRLLSSLDRTGCRTTRFGGSLRGLFPFGSRAAIKLSDDDGRVILQVVVPRIAPIDGELQQVARTILRGACLADHLGGRLMRDKIPETIAREDDARTTSLRDFEAHDFWMRDTRTRRVPIADRTRDQGRGAIQDGRGGTRQLRLPRCREGERPMVSEATRNCRSPSHRWFRRCTCLRNLRRAPRCILVLVDRVHHEAHVFHGFIGEHGLHTDFHRGCRRTL